MSRKSRRGASGEAMRTSIRWREVLVIIAAATLTVLFIAIPAIIGLSEAGG